MVLGRFGRGRRAGADDRPAIPVGEGPPRGVTDVLTPARVGRDGWLLVDGSDLSRTGRLLHLRQDGPGLIRPGDVSDADPYDLHGIAEARLVLAGEVDHRDSLGSRGTIGPPGVRLLHGGSGVAAQIGPSRALQRDGGDAHAVTVRWLTAVAPPTVPGVRVGAAPPRGRQGRSAVSRWVDPDGSVSDPGDTRIWGLHVAAGSSLDLHIPEHHHGTLLVWRGTALVGPDLQPVEATRAALLEPSGARLRIGTQLEGEDRVEAVLILTPPPVDAVVAGGFLAAADRESLDGVIARLRDDGFGPLPRLDG